MRAAMLGLDFAIFGNGYGLGTPFFDGAFYWLVDMKDRERHERRGAFYSWSGWFGAQLHSFQWTHPNAGERRVLNGREYRVFASHRRWFRVEVSWHLVELERCGDSIDKQNALLRKVAEELKALS